MGRFQLTRCAFMSVVPTPACHPAHLAHQAPDAGHIPALEHSALHGVGVMGGASRLKWPRNGSGRAWSMLMAVACMIQAPKHACHTRASEPNTENFDSRQPPPPTLISTKLLAMSSASRPLRRELSATASTRPCAKRLWTGGMKLRWVTWHVAARPGGAHASNECLATAPCTPNQPPPESTHLAHKCDGVQHRDGEGYQRIRSQGGVALWARQHDTRAA